jgi:predicted short-subunit dehydrogenase-like oxidoreductase (DUF2520 family)
VRQIEERAIRKLRHPQSSRLLKEYLSERVFLQASLGFIGPGAVGTVLSQSFFKAGYYISAIGSRSLPNAERLAQEFPLCLATDDFNVVLKNAQIIFLTVPDDSITAVCNTLNWQPDHLAIHCSGLLTTAALESASQRGARVAKMHPLLSMSPQAILSGQQTILPSCTMAIEAEQSIFDSLLVMVQSIGATPFPLDGSASELYHASAVIASNYLVTLLDIATTLWESFGVNRGEALEHLLPLISSTLQNIEAVGIPQALTGPIARGDIGTVQKHLEALARSSATPYDASYADISVQEIYTMLATRTIPLALAKGSLSIEKVQALLQLLQSS